MKKRRGLRLFGALCRTSASQSPGLPADCQGSLLWDSFEELHHLRQYGGLTLILPMQKMTKAIDLSAVHIAEILS